jgi:hypothetical protein
MGTRSALVAHVNKWPLSAVPIWPLNGKDGEAAEVSARRPCYRQNHRDARYWAEEKEGATVFETDLLTPMTGEDARLAHLIGPARRRQVKSAAICDGWCTGSAAIGPTRG